MPKKPEPAAGAAAAAPRRVPYFDTAAALAAEEAPALLPEGIDFTALQDFETHLGPALSRYKAGRSYAIREGNGLLAAAAAVWLAADLIKIGRDDPPGAGVSRGTVSTGGEGA